MLLTRRTNVQRTWRISERALHRPHERRRVDEGFATSWRRCAASRTIALPQWIANRNTRNDVRAHITIEQHASEFVWISNERQERQPARQAQHAGDYPSAENLIHHARHV